MNTQHMKLHSRTPVTMNTNHTSLYDAHGDVSGRHKPLFDIVGKGHEEKARRIAACVNACAGVDTATLVAMANGEMNGSEIWELAKVKQQRDELLAAAKITLRENLDLADGDCCTLYDLRTSVESVAPEWDMYGDCEAIAKAGGEA